VLIVVEVGLITPPVGMNLFVIQSMAPDISIRDAYRGVMPFVASDLVRVVILVLVPSITLFVVGQASAASAPAGSCGPAGRHRGGTSTAAHR
jgi:TRAP-type C4-dicarboxylate transport system permease large subunit